MTLFQAAGFYRAIKSREGLNAQPFVHRRASFKLVADL